MKEMARFIATFFNSIYNINLPIFENNIKVGTLFLTAVIIFFIINKVLGVGDKK